MFSQTFASALSSQTIAFTRAFSFPSEHKENQESIYKSIFFNKDREIILYDLPHVL